MKSFSCRAARTSSKKLNMYFFFHETFLSSQVSEYHHSRFVFLISRSAVADPQTHVSPQSRPVKDFWFCSRLSLNCQRSSWFYFFWRRKCISHPPAQHCRSHHAKALTEGQNNPQLFTVNACWPLHPDYKYWLNWWFWGSCVFQVSQRAHGTCPQDLKL